MEIVSMARSLDLDALTENDMLQLLEEILNRLPVRDLVTVRIAAEAKRHEKLEEAKQAVVEEMRGKLEELDLTLGDVLPRSGRRTGTRRRRRETGRSAPVKFRSPEGLNWTGKGRVPKWLQALEEQGRSRDEFLVSQEEQESRES
jgi:DNA-binding protein H-NS